MDFGKLALAQAKKLHGKISVISKIKLENKNDLAIAYTPGVAEVSKQIAQNPKLARTLTIKGSSVAIVSDGSAVLGLGDIGPEAALPVMEGKALLFKEFAGIDAYPIVLNTKDPDEIVKVIKAISPGFAGINLEDISAPRCFEIEERLQDIGIPVFHDDQHGTAIVIYAALINSLKVVNKKMSEVKIVISGAGAAGIATAKFLKPKHLVLIDSRGPIHKGRSDHNIYKQQVTHLPHYQDCATLAEAFGGADVFIGLSGKGILSEKEIGFMAKSPIIFALSNPTPEILPIDAKKSGAAVVATGRSDFPNQINNVLVFPGIFRGALDMGSKKITDSMKIKAAETLSSMVTNPTDNRILPVPLEKDVASRIAKAVKSN